MLALGNLEAGSSGYLGVALGSPEAGSSGYIIFQISNQTFVHHIVDDLSWRVERAGLLTSRCFGFGIVTCQQIFKHFTQKFGVKGNIFFYWCVFGNGELVGFQNIYQSLYRSVIVFVIANNIA